MIRFESDYGEGACPEIIEKLIRTNMEQTPGYGEDCYCSEAAGYIKKLCAAPDSDVHFLVGGTQVNAVVIASTLRPYQGVVAAGSGHINVHETGAIEASGHKVITVHGKDGKISAEDIICVYDSHYGESGPEHTVQPGMAYISLPTEYGTVYNKRELTEISEACRKRGLYIFMDGARLGYALTASGCDISMADIAALCDVFSIGGTKVGALFGEAVVITSDALKKGFRYNMKQRGAMLAKGRLLGIQFGELFRDGLYFRLARRGVKLAVKIKDAFASCGFRFLYDSPTNQQFVIINEKAAAVLGEKYSFSRWRDFGNGNFAARFCTSWATDEKNVEALVKDIKNL